MTQRDDNDNATKKPLVRAATPHMTASLHMHGGGPLSARIQDSGTAEVHLTDDLTVFWPDKQTALNEVARLLAAITQAEG